MNIKMIKPLFGIILVIVFFGCNSESEKFDSLNEIDSFENQIVENKANKVIGQNNEENIPYIEVGPPFKDTCNCEFNIIGGFYYNKNRYDLLISGKGWKPEYWSCTYAYGELICNEFPPDILITDYRIHLVDVDNIRNKLDSSIFESQLIQNNIIATQRVWPGDEYAKCKFDPNNTGKYYKPKQWIE